MKRHYLSARHPWVVPLGILALILGPVVLYFVLRDVGVPAAIVSGVVLLVAAKHLGLLAVILAPVYAFARRHSKRSKMKGYDSMATKKTPGPESQTRDQYALPGSHPDDKTEPRDQALIL